MKRRRGFAAKRGDAMIKRRRARNRRAQGMVVEVPFRQRGFLRTGGYYGRMGTANEMKFHDENITDAAITSTWQLVQQMNLIPQGTTEKQRLGRKAWIKKIQMRAVLTLPTTATAAETITTFRVAIVLDKQANGAAAAASDIWASDTWDAWNNLANSGRFRILYDKLIPVSCMSGSGRGSTDTLSYGGVSRAIKFFHQCTIPLEFSSTTGAITEIKSNNITLWAISSSAIGSLFGKIRLRFTG